MSKQNTNALMKNSGTIDQDVETIMEAARTAIITTAASLYINSTASFKISAEWESESEIPSANSCHAVNRSAEIKIRQFRVI